MNRFLIFLFLLSFSLYGDEPEALFLTWKNDPTTTMMVQWVSRKEDTQSRVDIVSEEGKVLSSFEGSSHPMPQNMPYLVHWTELTALTPDTLYAFTIPGTTNVWHFQTAPQTLSSITFAVGGDTYQSKDSWFSETCAQIAQHDPLFIAVGGDLAYASPNKKGENENGARWLKWLKLYSHLAVNKNRSIPLLVTIGNHDVKGHYNGTKQDAPFFYSLFSFPGEQGYNVLHFGNFLSFYFLDTNHTNPISGKQTEWLETFLQKEENIPNIFAIYHVPAYPSFRSFTITESVEIRKHWVPLFEKYHLHVAFENHEHVFKRAYPLKGGKSSPYGVLYIGDGSWGVKPRSPKKAGSLSYLAKTAATRQFLKVTLTPEKREFTSISPSGDIVDHYIQFMKREP